MWYVILKKEDRIAPVARLVDNNDDDDLVILIIRNGEEKRACFENVELTSV